MIPLATPMKSAPPSISFFNPLTLCLASSGLGALLLALAQSPEAQTSPSISPGPAGLTAEQLEILGHLSIVYRDDGLGGTKKTLRVTGIDVQVVNGLGATNGLPTNPESVDPNLIVTNGVGNLIIGYNEEVSNSGLGRAGSHNLIVGFDNCYSSIGSLVSSYSNQVSGPFANITGGTSNRASGFCSSVSAGELNHASGDYASVSAGFNNLASGSRSTVSGGMNGWAYGLGSSVSGGFINRADGYASAVSGGGANLATGQFSSVSGGGANTAQAFYSTVSGGRSRSAIGTYSWVGGALIQLY